MTKLPGVGWADANAPCPSVWVYQDGRTAIEAQINRAYRPFGEDGGGPAEKGNPDIPLSLLAGRYFPAPLPGISPQGLWGELWQHNIVVLERWFAEQPLAHRERYDGEPTMEDVYDLAVSQPRRSNWIYARYWFSRLAGGMPETAIIVDQQNWHRYGWVVRGDDWRFGLRSFPNSLGYEVWYDVRWLPEVEAPSDPPVDPPPPPPPDPEPEQSSKRYSTPDVRAEELWVMVEEVFRRAKVIGLSAPTWLIAMRQAAKPLALPLLPDVVRAKRKFLGQPEEGTP